MSINKDSNGNYIPWTGRPCKKLDRVFGHRFSVEHSSASGWYVFDNRDDRCVAIGLGSLTKAKTRARQAAREAKDQEKEAAPLPYRTTTDEILAANPWLRVEDL